MADKIWVVAANNAEAKIFRLTKFPKVEEIFYFENPNGRLHNRDLISSKPGRTFSSMGTARHAYQTKVDPREQEIEKFARTLAAEITSNYQKKAFEKIYIFASSEFLGHLRKHLGKVPVEAELPKDLVRHDKADIEEHLSALVY